MSQHSFSVTSDVYEHSSVERFALTDPSDNELCCSVSNFSHLSGSDVLSTWAVTLLRLIMEKKKEDCLLHKSWASRLSWLNLEILLLIKHFAVWMVRACAMIWSSGLGWRSVHNIFKWEINHLLVYSFLGSARWGMRPNYVACWIRTCVFYVITNVWSEIYLLIKCFFSDFPKESIF